MTKWTEVCPLCPPALSSRCPPIVQRKNKYSIYFLGVKNTVFIFGLENICIFAAKNTGIIFRLKNTRINSGTRKIPELFLLQEKYQNYFRAGKYRNYSDSPGTSLYQLLARTCPHVHPNNDAGQSRHISVPGLSTYYGSHTNHEFVRALMIPSSYWHARAHVYAFRLRVN